MASVDVRVDDSDDSVGLVGMVDLSGFVSVDGA